MKIITIGIFLLYSHFSFLSAATRSNSHTISLVNPLEATQARIKRVKVACAGFLKNKANPKVFMKISLHDEQLEFFDGELLLQDNGSVHQVILANHFNNLEGVRCTEVKVRSTSWLACLCCCLCDETYTIKQLLATECAYYESE